ncbi:hypothetical protein SESBI_29305 [Sesbania bispinosa]|nr:hypothetical protein SESBI_29305 [Sesbania bispinosa]
MAVREIPATNIRDKIGVRDRERRGVAAIDSGYGGGVGGRDRVKGGVGDDSVVGEVEEILDDKVVGISVIALVVVGGEKAALENLWCFHS